ncbi:tetratricopeptide repeat protein [candidate division KSB1 bacterium]|nr:tetratricopeptide repeat protein [candidate division KSB1 bacterium]
MPFNYSDEIIQLEKYLKEHPDSMFFARLADYYFQSEQLDKAINLCRTGIQKHPNYASGYFILAKCYFARKQYDEAERRLKKALSLEPKFVNAHKLYADLMSAQGWEKSSNASLRRVQEIDPFLDLEFERTESAQPQTQEKEEEVALEEAVSEDSFSSLMENESFFDNEMETVETKAPSIPESKTKPAAKTEKPEPPPVRGFVEELETEGIDEEELILDLDKPPAVEQANDKAVKEDEKFSDILDDIFGSDMDNEEEERENLEKFALHEEDIDVDIDDATAEPQPEQEASPPSGSDTGEKARFPEAAPPMQTEQQEPGEEASFEDQSTIGEDDTEPEEEIDSQVFDSLDDEDDFEDFLASLEEEEDIAGAEPRETPPPPQKQEPAVPADMPGHVPDEESEKTKDKFVTPTLGEIYAAQGQYEKAIEVFRVLSKKHPENEWYQTKLQYLLKKQQEDKENGNG